MKFPTQIDRYLAKLIFVPLLGTLCLAAMLLLMDRMLRLFDFVVSEGGPVSDRLADARQSHPRISRPRHPGRADARRAARLPQARALLRARHPARGRARLRPAARRALSLRARPAGRQFRHRQLRPAQAPITNIRACASSFARARSAPRSRSASSPISAAGSRFGSSAARIGGTDLHGVFVRLDHPRRPHASRSPPIAAPSSPPTIPTPSCSACQRPHGPQRAELPDAARAALRPARSADRAADDRILPRPRRRHQGADRSRAGRGSAATPARPRRGATRPAPISISAWSRWR